ncbi:MAG: TolC family protein [Sphingobacteriales bacterium]|nr:TolC family protein [Sphingobacteriales bacterium]
MKLIIIKPVAFISLLVTTLNVNAQQTLPVNLETVLKMTGANNLTVQEYQLKYKQALADRSKAKEWWLPNIYAGATTHYLNGAAMNTDGKIFTGLNRNNIWAGLGIATEIDFGKGIYQSLAAKQKVKAASYFSIAEKNKTVLNAVQTYFDLQAEQLRYSFLLALVNQSDTLSQQIKIQVDAGLRYQSEYLLAQSNFNHLKVSMLQAKVEWQRKSALLANLLNLENNISLVSADTALIPLALTIQPTDTSGFEKRPEYSALNAELKSFQISKKMNNQGLLLPKLRIGYDNGAFGAYSKTLYNTYQVNASLLWNLPLGRLTYKGDLKQWNSRIALQENKVEQFKNQYQQEISMATSQLQIASDQATIAKEALQLTAEALSQSTERQKLGTVKPFEVFQAQQFYLQAQIDYIKAVSEYNKAQFALKVAMGEIL